MARPRKCECGTCGRCKHREYMRDYYRRNPAKAEAKRQSSTAYRDANLDRVRAYDRARPKQRDPEKEKARRLAYAAFERGDLVREPCEVCGSEKVEAHHDDYSDPLCVRWLCRSHHMAIHRTVAA